MKIIRPGQLVYWRNEPVIVFELKGLSEVIVRTVDGAMTEIVRVTELAATPTREDGKAPTHHLFAADKDWDVALERYKMILPLLELRSRQTQDIERVAREAGKSLTTIYRWLNRFEETGLVSSLLRNPRSDKGEQRLSKEVEEIIAIQIRDFYLVEERPSVLKLYRRIKTECQIADVDPPNRNTIYARVNEINERELVRKRFSPRKAKEKFEPLRGKFPGGDFPNAVVQIDHSPVDVVVVDETHRLPIGRPYLTVAIDVATKMVSGFLMTLDPPSASSAGLCIAQAVLAKDLWLAKRDIQAEWPIYGKMRKIHVDNAKEFRGRMLKRATKQHGIGLEWRPKGQPNYGPHIERAFRTFMEEVHGLPGTTFSSVQFKGGYNSEGKACMTLKELDLWFSIFIVYRYHNEPHAGNSGIPPVKLYTRMILGTADTPGVGLPMPIEDEQTFRLDFTPYEERTIQRDGVVLDNIHYYSDKLRRWVESTDPEDKTKKRKFIFARDPRDISVIYFLDPETNTYSPVPYFNNTRPAISLWELRAVCRALREEAKGQVDEGQIFQGVRKMRALEESAVEKTKLARQHRAVEKRKRRNMERRLVGWTDVHTSNQLATPVPPVPEVADDDEVIEPFQDIQVGPRRI